MIANIGLQDRLLSLILFVFPSFTVPFSTWLLMGFFKTIPRDWRRRRASTGPRASRRSTGSSSRSAPGILTVVIFSFPRRQRLRLRARLHHDLERKTISTASSPS